MNSQKVTAESVKRIFAEKMDEYRIPGAVFVLVEDGAVTISEGFGFSDIEGELPVEPENTGFPVSTLSGLFTVILMLQLVDEGLVGISDDVSNYLPDFRMPRSKHGQPVVMDLLNHTDGFQESVLWSAVSDPAKRLRLDEFLDKSLRPTVCEPGRFITYGNLSMAIAGYIIETAAGDSYEEYIKERVFDPLGMKGTVVNQGPGNPVAAGEVAIQYDLVKGAYEPLAGFYSNIAPADGVITTGTDMGRLIVSLLSKESPGNGGILTTELLERMFTNSVSPAPGLPGVTCGFFERCVSGTRMLERVGEAPGVYCAVCLLPELNKGFFLAVNRRDGRIKEDLTGLFAGNGREADETMPQETAAAPDLHEYCGQYHYIQRSRKTIARYLSLSSNLLRVDIDDGEPSSIKVIPLAFGDSLGGFDHTSRWKPVSGDLFESYGKDLIAFTRNEAGKVACLCSGRAVHGCYEKVNWHESPGCYDAVAGAYFLFFLVVALISPVWIFTGCGAERWPAVLLFAVALLNILFITCIQPAVYRRGKSGLLLLCFSDRIDPFLACLLAVSILSATLSVLLVVSAAISWGWAYWSTPLRIFFTVASILSMLFAFFLSRLRLLGFRF